MDDAVRHRYCLEPSHRCVQEREYLIATVKSYNIGSLDELWKTERCTGTSHRWFSYKEIALHQQMFKKLMAIKSRQRDGHSFDITVHTLQSVLRNGEI